MVPQRLSLSLAGPGSASELSQGVEKHATDPQTSRNWAAQLSAKAGPSWPPSGLCSAGPGGTQWALRGYLLNERAVMSSLLSSPSLLFNGNSLPAGEPESQPGLGLCPFHGPRWQGLQDASPRSSSSSACLVASHPPWSAGTSAIRSPDGRAGRQGGANYPLQFEVLWPEERKEEQAWERGNSDSISDGCDSLKTSKGPGAVNDLPKLGDNSADVHDILNNKL